MGQLETLAAQVLQGTTLSGRAGGAAGQPLLLVGVTGKGESLVICRALGGGQQAAASGCKEALTKG